MTESLSGVAGVLQESGRAKRSSKNIPVNIDGSAFVTTKVQSHTLMPAHGPEMLRRLPGKISAEMIQGRPLAPKDQAAPKTMMAAVAALPPAMVLALWGTPAVGLPMAT